MYPFSSEGAAAPVAAGLNENLITSNKMPYSAITNATYLINLRFIKLKQWSDETMKQLI
jgi:hypothetical protein